MSEINGAGHGLSDSVAVPPLGLDAPDAVKTPGQLIKQAREHSGLHIVALAAALKVPVRKLEALEANRWEELQDVTFVRALASSVCRHLKLDPAAVLHGLPAGVQVNLDLPQGLGRAHMPQPAGVASNPVAGLGALVRWWPIALLLLGAGVLYFVPGLPKFLTPQTSAVDANEGGVPTAKNPEPGTVLSGQMPPMPTPSGDAILPAVPTVNGADASALPVPNTQASAGVQPDGTPGAAAQPATADSNKADAANVLTVRATAETWVEVVDATGRLRIQRVIKAGEVLDFSGATPYAVAIGRADSAQVSVRGQAFDVVAVSRNNVARFEVK